VVDKQVEGMVEEERRRREREEGKKREYYQVMVEEYRVKEEMRAVVESADRAELEKIAQYQSRLDQRDRQQKL
jgi:hypothetical protein